MNTVEVKDVDAKLLLAQLALATFPTASTINVLHNISCQSSIMQGSYGTRLESGLPDESWSIEVLGGNSTNRFLDARAGTAADLAAKIRGVRFEETSESLT